ncbi:uncharacterized protein N7482_003908 [Penicillium canariense]|uniref:Uncharacterized protein n=1 Tax=Penicillium canariense TaxID=189055 RepID=A0A9W9I5F0_9EURO|nr:uncharacterized protein N7482_003908 [Penicillium canariense]KAJ5168314.1 hypothetical protein N7482_003908 [Penicillium canariense]
MPIPTADFQDKESQSTNAVTTGSAGTTSLDSFAALDGRAPHREASSGGASASQNAGSDRQLSKEEADRLYEERMEEEYAKREGGA